MQVRKVTSGQMWKSKESGNVYVVTSLYNDVLSSFAVLRSIDHGKSDGNKRAKIIKTVGGEEILGFTPADLV